MSRMKPIWRAALFFLPLVVVFGTPAIVLSLGGEFAAPELVATEQSRTRELVLFGRAYTNPILPLKWQRVVEQPPEVLALGTSRVLQFRAEFFRPNVKFYNFGGCIGRIEHLRIILEKLPARALPKTLLLAADPNFFQSPYAGPGHTRHVEWIDQRLADRPRMWQTYETHWQHVWGDIFAGKIAFRRLAGGEGLRSRFGLNALCNEQGFRNDGSYLYGRNYLDITSAHHPDHLFKGTLKLIDKGSFHFAWAKVPSAPALDELRRLLGFCNARGIDVIGFLPPYPHAVWAKMKSSGEKYSYLEPLPALLGTAFAERGFEFYDFSDFEMLGAADSEAIDGLHGSERVYLRLLIAMIERGSRLNAYTSLPELRAALAASKTHTSLFPERL